MTDLESTNDTVQQQTRPGDGQVLQEQSGAVINTAVPTAASNTNDAKKDPEEEELQEIKTTFLAAPRFTKWRELYFDKDNVFKLGTFKNRQLSALIAYNLNPTDPRERLYASKLGHRNAKKCENWARDILAADEMTPEVIVAMIGQKAIETNNARYAQMIAEITGVYNPKAQTTITNTNAQQTIIETPGEEEAKDFNQEFRNYLKQE